jgi:aspartate/tyrosine/aromatic aminotransferase
VSIRVPPRSYQELNLYYRIVSAQTLGASGGCHVGAVMLKNHYGPWKQTGNAELFLPNDSWRKYQANLGVKINSLLKENTD